jgi:hypothetical protein
MPKFMHGTLWRVGAVTFLLSGFFGLQSHVLEGRMTGGGNIVSGATLVTFGTELHCDVSKSPNNLEVNFGGNHFHMDDLAGASCSLLGNPAPPPAPFNTYFGHGFGTYNGSPGYQIDWVFQDFGEPGVGTDSADITITAPGGAVILNASGTLQSGNLQAHAETGQ